MKMDMICEKTTIKDFLELFKNGVHFTDYAQQTILKGTNNDRYIYIRMSVAEAIPESDYVL